VALAAGFDHVAKDADLIATLACDLQDPPETILEFVQEWRKGASIVWGARRSRSDSHWRRAASRMLEIGLRRYAMPRDSRFQTGSFFLIERIVLDSVRQFREQARVTFALVAWTGFDQATVDYDRRMRTGGRSGWTVAQMLNTAYDVFIGFSPIPAKVLTAFGFVMLVTSIVAVFYLVFSWLVQDVQVGWTGLMATMTLCFGLLFVMIGISFEYLYRIFVEAKDRPLYFVSQQVGDVRRREPVGD
jgi:dolichol-phosphate mannosyltransferase